MGACSYSRNEQGSKGRNEARGVDVKGRRFEAGAARAQAADEANIVRQLPARPRQRMAAARNIATESRAAAAVTMTFP
ncbi:hypothetical protein XH98_18720 [Bradyrhizobium sp. CCBAU 51745]|nr:hypothetical protein [Bradyrhizobium sp. CCBAU 51745]